MRAHGLASQGHSDVVEPRLDQKTWEARADVGVGPGQPDHLRMEPDIALERDRWRIAKMAGEVDVLEHRPTSRAQGFPAFGQGGDPVREVGADESAIVQVERLARVP